MVNELILSKTLEEQGIAIEDILGKGAFGTVYSGRQKIIVDNDVIERNVAIKTLDSKAPKEIKDRFVREAKIGIEQKYKHDGLVEGINFIKEKELYSYVTEYVTGFNLREIINRDKLLPVDFSSAVIYKIGKVLEFLHDPNRSIIHRDIKPDNIMISNEGKVYLIDFGIAKIGFERDSLDDFIAGTISYISPEQVKGENTTPKSDLWSLGVTYYETLTGEKPFEFDEVPSSDESKQRILTQMYKRISSPKRFNRETNRKVSRIVKKLIGRNKFLGVPLSRGYKSASELNHDLEKVIKKTKRDADSIIKDYVGARFTFGNLGYNPDVDYFEFPNYNHPELKTA